MNNEKVDSVDTLFEAQMIVNNVNEIDSNLQLEIKEINTQNVDEINTTETSTEEDTPVKPLTLNEKAIALGINPEGMSRNKLKAAIKEAEAKK